MSILEPEQHINSDLLRKYDISVQIPINTNVAFNVEQLHKSTNC